ncbi:fungal-specific transcription factor domain-containing protein [Trichoderma velutinum]
MQGVRGFVSCSSCRQRKLRCDRNEPCSNCTARNIDCIYASLPRGRGSFAHRENNNQRPEVRLRKLERLLGTIISQMPENQASGIAISSYNAGEANLLHGDQTSSPAAHERMRGDLSQNDQHTVRPGRMMSSDDQTIYVSSVHWAAICNEIACLRENFDEQEAQNHTELMGQSQSSSEPLLLDGVREISSVEDILADIPPKDFVNRLISRYFTSKDHSVVIFHAPTFQHEYKRFWDNPRAASVPWISLLYAIMSLSVFLHMRSGDKLPEAYGNPGDMKDAFHRRSTECLLLSKYSTEPGAYTIEALLFNIQNEYVRCKDAHLGVWILAGIATRLAMRMGYHRDPSHYSQLSVFQGEMRRRCWAGILQMDALFSCQLGLPSMIQESQYDTQLPSNLLDEDFGPDFAGLPKSRPETDLTPVLYLITKTRFMLLFRVIFNQVTLQCVGEYDEIIALSQRLENAYALVSPHFRIAALEDCITVPPFSLIQRYNLELLFQKTRCILHRHHMAKSYQEPQYNFSRYSCVEAAMTILTHHANLHKEVQVGGLLHREKWFISSLEQHDFLLASMIVCLELTSQSQPSPEHDDEINGIVKFDRQELIKALEASKSSWYSLRSDSFEARKAFEMLSVMLDRVSMGTQRERERRLTERGAKHDNGNHTMSRRMDDDPGLEPSTLEGVDRQLGPPKTSQMTTDTPFLNEMDSFLNGQDMIDWDAWELFMKNSREESQGA